MPEHRRGHAGQFPAAEMHGQKDQPLALVEGGVDVLLAFPLDKFFEVRGHQRQTEKLHYVLAVISKDLLRELFDFMGRFCFGKSHFQIHVRQLPVLEITVIDNDPDEPAQPQSDADGQEPDEDAESLSEEVSDQFAERIHLVL